MHLSLLYAPHALTLIPFFPQGFDRFLQELLLRSGDSLQVLRSVSEEWGSAVRQGWMDMVKGAQYVRRNGDREGTAWARGKGGMQRV